MEVCCNLCGMKLYLYKAFENEKTRFQKHFEKIRSLITINVAQVASLTVYHEYEIQFVNMMRANVNWPLTIPALYVMPANKKEKRERFENELLSQKCSEWTT